MSLQLKRTLNEKKFPKWIGLPDGGRRYWYEIKGKFGFTARYVKEVDKDEETIRFYQEIYDPTGSIREVHEKYPIDLGHWRIKDKPEGV